MKNIELDITIRNDIRDVVGLKARQYVSLWYAAVAAVISLSSLVAQ